MITFRPLSEADHPTLLDWLQRPHVKAWWDDGDDTLEKVAAHYSADPDRTKRFIAEEGGRQIGYFQYDIYSDEHVGVDQFLAEETELSQGLGTRCLLTFIDHILNCNLCTLLSVDPAPDNARAIRFYEKCGFRHDPQGSSTDVYYMVRSAPPWSRGLSP